MLVVQGRLSFEDAPLLRRFIGVEANSKEAGP
jgi:hypothetical protein